MLGSDRPPAAAAKARCPVYNCALTTCVNGNTAEHDSSGQALQVARLVNTPVLPRPKPAATCCHCPLPSMHCPPQPTAEAGCEDGAGDPRPYVSARRGCSLRCAPPGS